ncbi:membrane dipeptidase [Candidatus Uhrbacteria bacterium]|nr:membrane dipeptidase [Candidatus Uhrbacteria bacterium]
MTYPIIDTHQDLLLHITRRDLYPQGQWQTNFEMIKRAGLKLVVATAFPVPSEENYFNPISNDLIEKEFDAYSLQGTQPGWMLVTQASDIARVLALEGPIGILMHIEGLNVVDENSFERLEQWYQKGWRSLGIVWNLTNPLGGGTKDPTQGLRPLGRQVIEWAKEKQMVIDFAHMNEPTFWDVVKIMDRPIYISHGNCRALCENPRNYSDAQLRALADSGGVIGLFFAKTFVTGKEKPGTISHVVAHVEHLLKTIGDEHIALGTDFGGIISGFVDGLESLEKLPDFFQALRQAGITEMTMEKLCYQNAARVLTAHLSL